MEKNSGADSGFHRGGANPKRGTSIHYVANFHRKLHENEEKWTERVGGPKFDYVDPPLTLILT